MTRSSSKRRGGRGRAKGSLLSTTLIVAAMVALPVATLGGGGYLAYQYLNNEQLDASYCYDRRDQVQVAAFVDFSLTHHLSDSQRRDLENALAQAYDDLPPNARLSVFSTDSESTATVSTPDFVICHPAETSGEQDQIDAPPASTAKLERQREEAREVFDAYLADLITTSTSGTNRATSSPILEQIQAISRYNFGGPLDQLILFSDGLNNSPAGQFCAEQGHLPRFAVFAERPGYRYVAPDPFGSADIDILLVEGAPLPQDNLPYCTTEELRTFWVDLFEANTSGIVRLTPLGYGAGQ